MERNQNLSADVRTVVEANNECALNLLRALRRNEEGNIFLSQSNISQIMAMVYAGAKGETAAQIRKVLSYGQKNYDLHQAIQSLSKTLEPEQTGEDPYELDFANAVWVQDGFELIKRYIDTMTTVYGAECNALDFISNPDGAVSRINGWVSDRTRGKIASLITRDNIDEWTKLILTSAIYFRGKWVNQFDTANTREDDFNLLDGSTIKVPTMWQTKEFLHAKGKGFQAVALPYRGGSLSMVILLPDADASTNLNEETFATFENGLSRAAVESLLYCLDNRYEDVVVGLPAFELDTTFSLIQAFRELGISDAFDSSKADFSAMTTTPPGLFISEILHQAYVKVNEEGTEATAATAVMMGDAGWFMEKKETIYFHVDRPFIFFIADMKTGTILFEGSIKKPQNSAWM